MGRCFIQLVMGPAGSGKSTYCHAIQEHCSLLGKKRGRTVHVANLDPAAEYFQYDVAFDIQELISVADVMEELGLGPNGALVYCVEYLLDNLDWLKDHLDEFDNDDEYLILDLPGQVELYTHIPIMRRIIEQMQMWGYGSSMISVFVVDATFVCDTSKFISGCLLSLSAMISLELPHVNILSKCDLVDEETVERILDVESANSMWDKEEEMAIDSSEQEANSKEQGKMTRVSQSRGGRDQRNRLTRAICSIIDDYSMVSFVPLNIFDEDSLDNVLLHVDQLLGYGEDLEIKELEENDEE